MQKLGTEVWWYAWRVSKLVRLFLCISLAAGTALVPRSAAAQASYPEKPIHIVVPYPPGSQADILARLLAFRFTEAWGTPVITDDVAGAAGNIGVERVARAAPDGYTLVLLGSPNLLINPILYKLTYDPIKDFTPISALVASPLILVVNKSVPVQNVEQLVSLAKAHPDELTFGSGGNGNAAHMAAELFKSMAEISIRHIPYKGMIAAMPDLIAGRITMLFGTPGITLPAVRDGKLRALAVTTSKRLSAVPELPTISESGYPNYEYSGWQGLLAPGKTPSAIIRKIHLEAAQALIRPDARARLGEMGIEAIVSSPDEFAATIKSDIPRWAKVIKDSGMKPE